MIHLTEAPNGTIPHRDLADRFDLDWGTLALHLKLEDRRIGPIALTLLETMGKTLQVTGGNAVRTVEHVAHAPIWARAHNLTTVAVLDAQNLTVAMVRHLNTLLPDVTLVGVCDHGTYDTAHRVLQWGGGTVHPLPWDQFDQDHPHRPAPTLPPPTDGYTMADLPHVDFLMFRHTARQLNDADRFTAIDEHYRDAYTAAHTVEPTIDAVIAHLDTITWPAHTTAPVVVAVRATQAALFKRGWLLRVRTDQLIGNLSSVRHPRPTDRDWKALRAYIRPERSAATALYLLGMSARDIPTLTIGDVEAALEAGTLQGRAIPDLARSLLMAEALRRRAEGHDTADPYLTLPAVNDRRHLEFIIDARRDLDMPIDARQIRNHTYGQSARTLNSLGLEIRSLA
jgi:hypothetical protein